MKISWPCGLALGLVAIAHVSFAQPPKVWRSTGIGGGGAFFAPSFSPYDSNSLAVSSDMSDQFRSANFGKSWTTTPFTRLVTGRNAPKIQYTSDPFVQYTLDFRGDAGYPVKSLDGGATWAPLLTDPTGHDAWNIVADPNNTNKVYVCSYSDLYLSNDGGLTFTHKYTAQGGGGVAIGGSFFDGNLEVLGTNDGLLVSTDGGQTLALTSTPGIPTSQAIVSFAGAKSGATTRFFVVTLGSGDVYSGVQGDDYFSYQGVYSLDWGSGSWIPRTNGIAAGQYPFFVAMARNDVNTAYLGGSSNGYPMVLKTTNAGSSWTANLFPQGNANVVTGWQGSGGDRDWGYAELCFGLAVAPTDSTRVAFTDYGFVHLTANGGASWRQAYVDQATENPAGQSTPKGKAYRGVGLEDTSAWWVAWADANAVWASFSDIRGIRSTDGGNNWAFNYSGHTLNASYQVVVHPSTGTMFMAASSVHDLYESTYLTDARIDGGSGSVLFSTDKGATWRSLGSTITKPVVCLALDPTNANRLYASVVNSATGGVYVCNNIGSGQSATWTKLPNPPRTEGHPFNLKVLNDGTLVATYSGRRTTVFTASSGVFVSSNGGQTWADRSHPNMQYWTKDITIDPFDPNQNKWYVGVYSGWGGPPNGTGGLYRSLDRGQSWTRINALDRVGSCTFNPRNANELYLTTETDGLWWSFNAQAMNPTFKLVGSYPFRQPERVFFNPYKNGEVWVTSFGNGLRVGTELSSQQPVP
ncbi:MAG: hypothetical protein JSS66_09385 [Armatimonadetes bacterium]|nr:hypothetical protein [Armatimonadota bacterium]